jgi:hypothetical protein
MIHVKVVFYVLSYNNGIFIVSRKKLLCKRVSFNIAQRFATGGTDTSIIRASRPLKCNRTGGIATHASFIKIMTHHDVYVCVS